MEKKTPLNSDANVDVNVDGVRHSHESAQRYEALRRAVLEPVMDAGHDVRGLALFLRKGMAAWMQGLRQLPCTRPAAVPSASGESPSKRTDAASVPIERVTGVEQMLVNILAAMTQANAAVMEA